MISHEVPYCRAMYHSFSTPGIISYKTVQLVFNKFSLCFTEDDQHCGLFVSRNKYFLEKQKKEEENLGKLLVYRKSVEVVNNRLSIICEESAEIMRLRHSLGLLQMQTHYYHQ